MLGGRDDFNFLPSTERIVVAMREITSTADTFDVIECHDVRVFSEISMSNDGFHRRVTLADVAKAAGVSSSTVDRVLNGRAPVRKETAERIHAAAEAVGFHASGIIRERVKGKHLKRTLGFLLQQPDLAFYQELGAALEAATEAQSEHCHPAVIEFMDDISPQAVSKRLRSLAEHVDAVAVVAADHAVLAAEVERLRGLDKPVFALISDLSTPARAGYAGLDNRSVGRTAAWFITRGRQPPGPVAIFVGSHRFQCQELAEMSFRSYMREHAPEFELLEPLVTLESNILAEEGARDFFQRHPDIAGFFVAGGGIDGVLRAVTEHLDNVGGRVPVGVARELTRGTHKGLLSGHLDAVLSHPLPQLAGGLVRSMIEVLQIPSLGLQQVVVPLDTQTPESGWARGR